MAVAPNDVLQYDTRDDQDRELEYPPSPSDPELEKIDQQEDRGSDYSPNKRKRKNSFSESQRGRKKPPRLTREDRSNIRLMSKHGVADSTLAKKLGITQRRIEKAIRNSYNPPDDVNSDDDYVSREVTARFQRKAAATPASPPIPPPRPTAKVPQRTEPRGQSSNSGKINSGPNRDEAPVSLNARVPGSRPVTVHHLLCNLQPPMPQLLKPLQEAGLTDDTLLDIVKWPPEKIFEFFEEELVRSKVLDRLQSFVVKRALVGLAASSTK